LCVGFTTSQTGVSAQFQLVNQYVSNLAPTLAFQATIVPTGA
jgi:hypothetical protein